ncbi:MAG: MATE family efflux transporter [Bacteroidales bacterium]|nr:MATE family efflux transporter [Bacteroidales bacterium]
MAVKVKDMTTGRPFSLILKFSLPLMLGNLLQQTYSLTDAAIVGNYIDINALGAIGASTSVMFFILGFCNGCGSGFAIPIAQKFGAKDYSLMRCFVNNSLKISVVISLILTVITALMCRQILHWLNTPEEIFEGAYMYLLITFLGIPATFFYNLLSAIIRALGDSKTPFYFLIISTVLNIGLDFLFILGLNFGVGGAALATLTAQAISVILCWFYMQKNFSILKSEPFEKQLNRRYVGILLNAGVPMGLQFSITAIGSMMLQNANNSLGTVCVAAFTTAMRIKMFFMCVLDNLGIAMATYCGQNYGAKKTSRILTGIKDSMIMMAVYSVVMFFVQWFFAREMGTWFMDSSEVQVLDNTELFLRISVSFYLALGALAILRCSIQGVGYTKLSMFSGVSEMIARVLISLFIVPKFGFLGVCFGDPMAWCAADLFLIPAFIGVYKKITANSFSNDLNENKSII